MPSRREFDLPSSLLFGAIAVLAVLTAATSAFSRGGDRSFDAVSAAPTTVEDEAGPAATRAGESLARHARGGADAAAPACSAPLPERWIP